MAEPTQRAEGSSQRMRWEDATVYALAGIYLLLGVLFFYAGAIGVLIGLVLLMPPYRPARWLSERVSGR